MIKFYDPLIEMFDIYYLQVIAHNSYFHYTHLPGAQVNWSFRCAMNNCHIHKPLIISAEKGGKDI